jgi:outer membrane protein
MKLTLFPAALAAGAALCLPLAAAGADLTEIYHRALRSDPQLREAEANRAASLEAKPQALGALLPQLTATGGYAHDDLNSVSPFTTLNTQNQVVSTSGTTISKTNSTVWAVQLRQTVFRWDQFATLRQADARAAQAEVDFRAAQQDVIVRTAQAYFNVLAARDTLDAAEASSEAILRQLEQAEKRFEVGLIAITDVEEARAAADQAKATVIGSKRTLATARDQLREVTGDSFDELARPSDDMPLIAPNPTSEDQWVKAALDQNLALSSARIGADIAHEAVSVARGGHLPTLDLVAKRSGMQTSGDTTFFDASGTTYPFGADNSNRDKQVSLQLTVPIYAGGATNSRVREAVYRHRAARERLERTARATERGTRDAYLGVISEISRVMALKQALESSRIALTATEAGYDVGTRTAVDVLLARQRLFDAQTAYARSRYDYVLNVLTLEQQTGTLDEARLARVNAWLDQTISVK